MLPVTVLVVAIVACSLARPPGDTQSEPVHLILESDQRYPRVQELVESYRLPNYVIPAVEFRRMPITRTQPTPPLDYDWLSKEIDRLSSALNNEEETDGYDVQDDGQRSLMDSYDSSDYLQQDETAYHMPNMQIPAPYEEQIPAPYEEQIPANHLPNIQIPSNYQSLTKYEELPGRFQKTGDLIENNDKYKTPQIKKFENWPNFIKQHEKKTINKNLNFNVPSSYPRDYLSDVGGPAFLPIMKKEEQNNAQKKTSLPDDQKKTFALTPNDNGYFDGITYKDNEPDATEPNPGPMAMKMQAGNKFVPKRHPRRNPNHSKSKSFYSGNLNNLKTGFSLDNRYSKDDTLHKSKSEPRAEETVYWTTFVAVIGGAFTFAVFGFAFAWFIAISKKTKAAADMDYPGYGVTGPNTMMTGDSKLAHSAHMFHYQHQKQQIIAMSSRPVSERRGSVSDPESEEENAEGDYTVYECPGFASTGNMEVTNPMFSEDSASLTPANMQLVQQQPEN